jgi:hypothetical protein
MYQWQGWSVYVQELDQLYRQVESKVIITTYIQQDCYLFSPCNKCDTL